MMVDAWFWAEYSKLKLGGQSFTTDGHEYQIGMLQCDHPNQCGKKGAQLGYTAIGVLKTLHAHIYGRLPQGTLYLFPTWNDVTDFSKARFNPLIYENSGIARHVRRLDGATKSTEAATIKRIGKAMLYLRSARETGKIEGTKATSSALKSVPVDRIVFDERDEMSNDMVDLAMERVSHSHIKEIFKLSTPSIPDFGIDKDYTDSDQRIWVIKCDKCNTENCLELNFIESPERAVIKTKDNWIRACKKCSNELNPRYGQWVAQVPSEKDKVGWWISQLNSTYINPGSILDLFKNPPNGNIAEVYNSKLGMAYIASENKLTRNDVYRCCGQDVLRERSTKSCAMGVDIGKDIHVVIGYPKGENYKIIYMGRVGEFADLHDLAQRFNVQSTVIDMEPETRKARDFQTSEPYQVYLCDYQDRLKAGTIIDEKRGLITVQRTEICDKTHDMVVTDGKLEIPRKCPEVEEFAKELSNIAKVLEEDKLSGKRIYRYRKLGADHYRHALNYFYLACENPVLLIQKINPLVMSRNTSDKINNDYDPLYRNRLSMNTSGKNRNDYDPLFRNR